MLPEPFEFVVDGVRIVVKHYPSVGWRRENPVLGDLELAFDTTFRAFKRGDGLTPWNQLPWYAHLMDG